MCKKFIGAFVVVAAILTAGYLYNHVFDLNTLTHRRLNTQFQINSIQPHTPQDYILFGRKIDINTATAEIFETLPGIGQSLAGRIVEYRASHGRFGSPDDLASVKGIGPKTVLRLRPFLQDMSRTE